MKQAMRGVAGAVIAAALAMQIGGISSAAEPHWDRNGRIERLDDRYHHGHYYVPRGVVVHELPAGYHPYWFNAVVDSTLPAGSGIRRPLKALWLCVRRWDCWLRACRRTPRPYGSAGCRTIMRMTFTIGGPPRKADTRWSIRPRERISRRLRRRWPLKTCSSIPRMARAPSSSRLTATNVIVGQSLKRASIRLNPTAQWRRAKTLKARSLPAGNDGLPRSSWLQREIDPLHPHEWGQLTLTRYGRGPWVAPAGRAIYTSFVRSDSNLTCKTPPGKHRPQVCNEVCFDHRR
jgi:hypothetical protein